MIKPLRELDSLGTHENQLYKENMRIIDEINSLNTYDDLIQYLDNFKKYGDTMNEKLFVVFFHRISEYFTDLNKSSKQIIFSKVFGIDYEKKLDEGTKNLVNDFIEAEYTGENIINIFRNGQILEKAEVNKNHPLEIHQNSVKVTVEGIRNNCNLEIKDINSPENLIKFIKELDGKKLDLNNYNLVLSQLKEDVPNISYLSFCNIFTKIFGDINLIKLTIESHFNEYIGDNEGNICIFSPENDLLNEPIFLKEELILVENNDKNIETIEMDSISNLEELIKYFEDKNYSDNFLLKNFDTIFSKIEEYEGDFISPEEKVKVFYEIFGELGQNNLLDKQFKKYHNFIITFEEL